MNWLVGLSIAIRVAALFGAVRVARRVRDPRIAFIVATLAVATLVEVLGTIGAQGAHDPVAVLGGLALSAMLLLSVWLSSGFIAEKRQNEVALREREAHYRSLIENSLDVIALLDEHGKLLYTSPATRRVLGYEPEELVGRYAFDFVAEQDLEHTLAMFADALCNPGRSYATTGRVRKKDGGIAVMQIAGSVLWTSARARRALIEMRDVTAEHEAADEKQRLEAELHQAQKLETLGTLAGGVAHDFNNLLTPILGAAELCATRARDDQEQLRLLSQIRSAAGQARDLVQRMLVFSRKSDRVRHPVDISAVMRETLELVSSSLPPSVRLQTDLPRDLGSVMADDVELQQVLINLCTNAAHAMGGQPGLLRVRLRDADPDASVPLLAPGRPSNGFVVLEVADTGAGMDERTRERIFEPFFTTKSPSQGTGLGLSMVHGVVGELGGFVEVDSELGSGTRFKVYLPRAEPGALSDRATPDNPSDMQGTVLLVDDTVSVARVAAELLSSLGFDVVTADSAVSAAQQVATAPEEFFAVVSDYAMPGMTGVDLARELRRMRADLPIVITTGFAEDDVIEAGCEITGLVVLQKPYAVAELGQAIARASASIGEAAAAE